MEELKWLYSIEVQQLLLFFSSLPFKEWLVLVSTEKTVEITMTRSADQSLLGNLWILNIGNK